MTGIDYIAVQESAEFQELRSKHRRFVFPVTAAAFGWFILYVLLASYARDFMATQVFGHVNIGLLLGLVAVRHDVRHHRLVRPLREQGARPARRAPAR